ncbi:MAG: Spy/CpxP family protein refolding chaperone [Candidatus Sulfotelmatobacter sp.]
MIKRFVPALMLAGLIFAVALSAVAQDSGNSAQQPPPSQAEPEHGPGHGHFDPAERTAMLTKELKLTSDQQSKVQDILKQQQSQMDSQRSDSSLSREDRRSKMMDIHKKSNDQIRALLDADQQKKWDEMQSKREDWMHGHHDGGQAPSGPPNSAPPQ